MRIGSGVNDRPTFFQSRSLASPPLIPYTFRMGKLDMGHESTLQDVAKKSGMKMLTELAASFTSRNEYLAYLEKVAATAFKDALCVVTDREMGISETVRSENAYGRAAAFLMQQEQETTRRLNQVVCGRVVEEGDAVQI